MVLVSSSTGGSNIGFIYREVNEYEIHQLNTQERMIIPSKNILSIVKDSDKTIQDILANKLEQERQALERCREIIGDSSDTDWIIHVFATELQFDNRRLTIFLQQHDGFSLEDRILYELTQNFRMNIKIVYVTSFEKLQENELKYMAISRLNVAKESCYLPVASALSNIDDRRQSRKIFHSHATPPRQNLDINCYSNSDLRLELNQYASPYPQISPSSVTSSEPSVSYPQLYSPHYPLPFTPLLPDNPQFAPEWSKSTRW